jgi:hypothetical protein
MGLRRGHRQGRGATLALASPPLHEATSGTADSPILCVVWCGCGGAEDVSAYAVLGVFAVASLHLGKLATAVPSRLSRLQRSAVLVAQPTVDLVPEMPDPGTLQARVSLRILAH